MALLLWVLTYIGDWFNGLTIVILGECGFIANVTRAIVGVVAIVNYVKCICCLDCSIRWSVHGSQVLRDVSGIVFCYSN
jgi:hypothetical protein